MANRLLSFRPNGRFGNHVFQYIATKVLQKYLPTHVYHFQANVINPSLIVTDETYESILEQAKKGEITADSIVLEGYFQFSSYLVDHNEYIRNLCKVENDDLITFGLSMKLFASVMLSYQSKFTKDDIVVHLRLDDFVQQDKGCAVIHPQSYMDLIDSLRYRLTGNVYIIVDHLKYPFEHAYVKNFEKYNPVMWIGSSMQEDLARCFWAPNLICSNSTFCWIAVLFSPLRYHWFPESVNVFTNQKMTGLTSQSILYPTKRLL